jgi:hypothetical protein
MRDSGRYGWVTAKPLLFNDADTGLVFEIPAAESCLLLDSVEDAKQRGLLKDDQEVWAAKVNIQRGYCLVLLKGKVRGVSLEDLIRR